MVSTEAGRTRGTWSVHGGWIAATHAVLGYVAFVVALVVCLALHRRQVVKNHVAGWPDEYWPSVSATIGDWFPERNVFQILIALNSGPRLAMIGLCALLAALHQRPYRALFVFAVGFARTLSCGGWVFVTSSDHALLHDVAMGVYIGLTPVWMYACLTSFAPARTSPHYAAHQFAQKLRIYAASAFFGCTPFMVYFYLRHRQERIPGAYTHYAMFEWLLVVFDVLFDAASVGDLQRFRVHVTHDDVVAVDEGADAVDADTIAHMLAGTDAAPPAVPSITLPTWFWVVSQTYLSFTAWSAWASLLMLIFYFSVSNMAAMGHELLLASQISGMLVLAYTPVRTLLLPRTRPATVGPVTPKTMGVLWTASFATIASFVVPSPLLRLLANAASVVIITILSALDWATAWEAGQMNESVTVWMLGLLLFLVSRYFTHANSPLSPLLDASNGGLQVPALVLCVVCVVPLLAGWARPRSAHIPRRADHPRRTHALLAAMAVGAWLCMLQTLLADSGTMVTFGWTGYPVKGPEPVRHGIVVIAAVATSIVATMHWPTIGAHPAVLLLTGVGLAALVYLDNWASFAGGVLLALALPALGTPLLQSALRHDPFSLLTVAWVVYSVLMFLGVLTVAYAFLPGAYIMREHTDVLLWVQYAMLVAGVWSAQGTDVTSRLAIEARATPRAFRATVYALVALLIAAASIVPGLRHVPASAIVPYHPQDRVLTAGIWTVHFGIDQNMRESSRRMARILKTLELDVVGLLETDLQRPAFGNRDLTQYLAEELQMYADIGPSPKKHTWGAVLLSKFPIINSTHHLLPSPHGELAPAIHAVLDVYGVPTHVVVSHNGQEEDALDRELQTTEIARILRATYPAPAIFLGYVVTEPLARRPSPYEILFSDGRILDVDQEDMDRWCQYLGYRAFERVAYARVSRYTVTDTELQTFKLRVPAAPVAPDRDALPRRLLLIEPPNEAWAYPTSLVKPKGSLHQMHMYGPKIYPQYFGPTA